jgi:hypothetical protein
MRGYKPGGLVWVNDGYTTVEHESYTCGHCNRIVVVPHKERPENMGDICHGCMHLICADCVGRGCRPIEKWCEQEEARGRFRRELG